METDNLASSMQDILAEMAAMQAELNQLKARADGLSRQDQTSPEQPANPVVSTTRRNTLKRLGLALLGGVATATVMGAAPAVQAKVIANPQSNGLANHVGMLVLPPGAAAPTGTAPAYNFGLVAFSETTAFDLSTLPGGGNSGIYGNGGKNGIYGNGGINGVYGYCSNNNGSGVFGNATGATSVGVNGTSANIGVAGSGSTGVYGIGVGSGSTGFYGYNIDINGTAVSGVATTATSTGVFGKSPRYAGLFDGNVNITGLMNGAAKFFKIDHPQDPANKYLNHASIESSDMKNLYDGVVTLDQQGQATVGLPDWFEALNSDYRYQLTCLGSYTPVFIAQEIQDRSFKIAGGKSGQRISWQVTGIRQDAWTKAHPIKIEEIKTGEEKGKYIHPELLGQPEEMGVHWRPVITKED